MTSEECKQRLKSLGCCIILPTYNNAKTIANVVSDALAWCEDVYVVNDGSTDETECILGKMNDVNVISYSENRGKGHALKTGLRQAIEDGYRYAITMDSDGQHYATDIPVFAEAIEANPDTMIIGARNLRTDGMPGKNTFANKFSNFWFHVETLQKLDDTQSGFRLYPLRLVEGMKLYTPRYEFEVESIVRLAWKGAKVMNVPINVVYPEDRVSHFRPLYDFGRISVLNTVLFTLALTYYYPVCFARWVDKTLIHSTESAMRLASAVALGVCISTMPAWGFQTLLALGLAHLLKLNKIVVVAFSYVSLPPFIPFILYGSMVVGGAVMGRETSLDIDSITVETAKECLVQYVVGGVIFSVMMGMAAWMLSFGIIRIFRK